MLYKVLKDGIRQRSSEGGWSAPKVGDVIKVSDIAAPTLIAKGFIAPHGGGQPVAEEPPLSRRERRKKAWLGLGGDAPPAPLGQGDATEPPATPDEKEGGTL